MGISRLQGTPWHLEQYHREEGEDRRYKGRCRHYEYESDRCAFGFTKCKGSAHCMEYDALSDEEFKEKQKANQKAKKKENKGEDDCFWYT